MIDDAAMSIVQENLELATNFIVKTACEKVCMIVFSMGPD